MIRVSALGIWGVAGRGSGHLVIGCHFAMGSILVRGLGGAEALYIPDSQPKAAKAIWIE